MERWAGMAHKRVQAELQQGNKRGGISGRLRVWLGLRVPFAFLRLVAVRGGRLSGGRGLHSGAWQTWACLQPVLPRSPVVLGERALA